MFRRPSETNLAIAAKISEVFHVQFDLSNILFTYMTLKPYISDTNERSFGEKLCMLCELEFEIYGIQFETKILHFQYEKSYDVLKLGIEVISPLIRKEIEYCCNYLQRRRNINLLFLSLTKFAERVENRRRILENVISKNPWTQLNSYTDGGGGLWIKYHNTELNVLFGTSWKIQWNTDHSIHDIVEIYYKDIDLPNAQEIKDHLVSLSHPTLTFNKRAEVWNSLFNSIESNLRDNANIDRLLGISNTDNPVIILDDLSPPSPLQNCVSPKNASSFCESHSRKALCLSSFNKKSIADVSSEEGVEEFSIEPSSSTNTDPVVVTDSENSPTASSSFFDGLSKRVSSTPLRKASCVSVDSVSSEEDLDFLSSEPFSSLSSFSENFKSVCKKGSKIGPKFSIGKRKANPGVVIAEADSVVVLSDEEDVEVSDRVKRRRVGESECERTSHKISSSGSSSSRENVVILD